MSTNYNKMFGGTSGYASPGYSSPHQSMGPLISPSTSGYGVPTASGGSPVFQGSLGSRFPAGGGPVVFSPHSNASPTSVGMAAVSNPAQASPYSYMSGGMQSPAPSFGGSSIIYSPPPYASTISSTSSHLVHPSGPMAHNYGPPQQPPNLSAQPYGYGAKVMAGSYAFHSPYTHHTSPYHTHHSPRDELVEPMHCSPVGPQGYQFQPHGVGNPQYQQYNRPPNSPPRPQYLPAYFTGIDNVIASASVPQRPRRVFERSPSTSPQTVGTGSRSPQSKSPNWNQQDMGQPNALGSIGYSGQMDGNSSGGAYTKRGQGQGPSRQLRFTDTQYFQDLQAAEEKEKTRKTGPPVNGFGTSEEISNFLNAPQLRDNPNLLPGSVIAQEAIAKAGSSTPKAESNWITVFGFPAAAASFIYTHFAQYGSVIQSKSNPGGNWLHIHYGSIIDARRALACNGKVLGGSIMVGVITSPKEVIEMYEKSQVRPSTDSGSTSMLQQSNLKSPLQERNVDRNPDPNKFSIRPLAGSSQMTTTFVSPAEKSGASSMSFRDTTKSSNEPQNENIPLPTTSGGLLTRAMEYMFDW